MFSSNPLVVLCLFTALIIAIQFPQTCRGCASFCGNLPITNPFRLKGDPKNCGDPDYELVCENNSTTFLHTLSQKYYVKSIDYTNFTIRLVDPGVQKNNCSSLPLYSGGRYYLYPYRTYRYNNESHSIELAKPVTFLTCPYPVNSSSSSSSSSSSAAVYVDASACINGSANSYVIVGGFDSSQVRDSCTIELISWTSFPMKDDHKLSFSEIHNALLYGFDLSWSAYKCDSPNCTNYCYVDHKFIDICFGSNSGQYKCFIGFSPFHKYYFEHDCGLPERLLEIAMRFSWRLIRPPIGVYIGARIVFGVPSALIFLIIMLRRRHWSMFENIEGYLQSQNNLTPIRYPYSEIKKMAKGFKDKLGEGGYGSVYKGKLRSGHLVAIKILGKSKTSGQDFISEVSTIGRIHHVNVVRLIGYCVERSKRVLVYDFMPNKSLDKYLFPREEQVMLSWERKYKIALGVARGIEYLHRGCDMQILHFDIKPHNILLDENFVPKVSDFGLARLYPTDNSIVSLTAARGTIGYVAPELINRSIGGISYKADVYSFGMLLMEIAGLKKNLERTEENSSQYFPNWIYDQFNQGKEIEMESASTDDERKIVKKITLVALWCTQINPADRPSMTIVLKMLEGEVESLQLPSQPFQSPYYTSIQDQTWTESPTDSAALLCNASNSTTLEIE